MSRTYQKSTQRNESNATDERNFAHQNVRRIKAESMLDIVSQVTNTKDKFRGLPLGVREELQTLFGTKTLDIAEPGAEFQATDVVVNPKLPRRRLVAAGCTADYCLVYYERGGIAHTWHVALFHWTPAATRFEWGGTAAGGLATIEEVQKAVLSGAIKGPAKAW